MARRSWALQDGVHGAGLLPLVLSVPGTEQRGEPELGTQSPRSAGSSTAVLGAQFATQSLVGCGEEQPSI